MAVFTSRCRISLWFFVTAVTGLLACGKSQDSSPATQPAAEPAAEYDEPEATDTETSTDTDTETDISVSIDTIKSRILSDYSRENYATLVDDMRALVGISKNDLSQSLIDTLADRLATVNEQYQNFHEQERLSVSNVAEIKVATLNAGLLCKPGIVFSESGCTVRRAHLPAQLAKILGIDGVDVLLLQELWEEQDFVLIAEAAANHGFHIINQTLPGPDEYGNGLQILLRESTFPTDQIVESGFVESRRALWEILNKVDRGVLYTIATASNGRKFMFGTVHNTPDIAVIDYYHRDRQREQLSATIAMFKDKADFFIVGGDFNYSPDFKLSNHLGVIDTQLGARSYIKFAEENQIYRMTDTYRTVNSDKGFTWDEVKNNFTEKFDFLTGQKRLDFLWLGCYNDGHAYTTASQIIFDEFVLDSNGNEVLWEEQPFNISDHFGVLSTISFE